MHGSEFSLEIFDPARNRIAFPGHRFRVWLAEVWGLNGNLGAPVELKDFRQDIRRGLTSGKRGGRAEGGWAGS